MAPSSNSEEANHLITSDQDVFVLLAFLRANNGPTRNFIVANALAKEFGWGRKRFADTRRRLEGTYIRKVRWPSYVQRSGPVSLGLQGWSELTTYPQLTLSLSLMAD